MKGMALHPRVEVENPEGYFSCKNPLWVEGLNPCWAQQPRAPVPGRRAPIASGSETWWGFLLPGWDGRWWKPRCPLPREVHKISLSGTHPGSGEGMAAQRMLEWHGENELVAAGRRLERQPPTSLCWVSRNPQMPYLLAPAFPSWHLPWELHILAPPWQLPVALPCQAPSLHYISFLKNSRIPGKLQWGRGMGQRHTERNWIVCL